MNFQIPNQNLSAGVLGGTFLSALTHIGSEDIVTTIVLAIIRSNCKFYCFCNDEIFCKNSKKTAQKIILKN